MNYLDIEKIAEDLLRNEHPVCLTVFGPSMRPTLRDGDRVQIVPSRAEELKQGDIALFRQHGRLSLHRLVGRAAEGRLFFAGDADLWRQELADPKDVLGRAAARERDARVLRLDCRVARLLGMTLFWSRPLRRLAWALRNAARGRPAKT